VVTVDHHSRRHLTIRRTGISSAVLVRVTANHSSTGNSYSADELSERFFSMESVSVSSQYHKCSGGQFKFEMAIPGGFAELFCDADLEGKGMSNTIENDLVDLFQDQYGSTENYDHVLFCMPSGMNDRWIGYAYGQTYRSYYNDRWCGYYTLPFHELGHNLGLQHSNELREYEDRSCLMGRSYGIDGSPEQCFNGVKFAQLDWFPQYTLHVNPLIKAWSGQLVAFVDVLKLNRVGSVPIILRVGDTSLVFNRAKDYNNGVVEKKDYVTIAQGSETPCETCTSEMLGGIHIENSPILTLDLNFDGTFERITFEACRHFFEAGIDSMFLSIRRENESSTCNDAENNIPSQQITLSPSASSETVTSLSTGQPVSESTPSPNSEPTKLPTISPTASPTTALPTNTPTFPPILYITNEPTYAPIIAPTDIPIQISTLGPTADPTSISSNIPSNTISIVPTTLNSVKPSDLPTRINSSVPSAFPTLLSSETPSEQPTRHPTLYPVTVTVPSSIPTKPPTMQPTISLTPAPIASPTSMPLEINAPVTSPPPPSTPNVSGQPSISEICDDLESEKFYVPSIDQNHGCFWLQARPEFNNEVCGTELGKSTCPGTCGVCSDDCIDTSTKFYVDSAVRDCEWLKLRPHLKAETCFGAPNAALYCPETCDTCDGPQHHPTPASSPSQLLSSHQTEEPNADIICDDEPYSLFFVRDINQFQRCVWLAARPEYQEILCSPNHESGAYSICEETCKACNDDCEDTAGRFQVGEVSRDCLWLSLRPHMQEHHCKPDQEAFITCPETCNACDLPPSYTPVPSSAPVEFSNTFCDDDKWGTFYVEDIEQFQKCVWLTARPDRIASLCREDSDSQASIVCPETCGVCKDACVDSRDKFTIDGKIRDCLWLFLRPTLHQQLCTKSEIQLACPETCDVCDAAKS